MKLRSIILGLLLALASPLAAFAQCSGQAPATTYCGNPTGALALPGWKPFSGIPGAALTKVDDTNVTLTLGGTPTTALLRAASLTLGWTGQLGLTRGGTAASLTASNGGIVYSTAAALAILSGTATANRIVMSGSSAAPSWSTATYPATTTVSQLLYSSSANVITGLATANSGILNTNGSGVPSITPTPTIGVNGGTGGQITFNGSTSGSVALRVAAAAGTGTIFQLPADNGTNTYVLQTNGSGVTSWVAAAGGGTVTSITCAATLTCTASNPITTTGTIALNVGNANAWTAAQTIQSTSANAFAVGANGSTNPAFNIDASTASSATGLNVKSAAAAGGVALSVLSSGTNENLTIDAKGSGTITLGGTSTGSIIHTRATTLSAALTYGGVTLSNAVTGTGNMVLSASPTLTGTITAPAFTAPAATSLSFNVPTGQNMQFKINNVGELIVQAGNVYPVTDNVTILGGGANRWSAVVATQYYAGAAVAGLASKTCTINTANVTTGITITITGGIVTGTTTC